MAEQMQKPLEPRKPVGFVAVSIGRGINEIFRGLGVDCLIEGGSAFAWFAARMILLLFGRINTVSAFTRLMI